jgi:6-phosphogluconolactonase
MNQNVRVYSHREALARAVADYVAAQVSNSVAERGVATLVLSGGTTPRSVYTLLSAEPYHSTIPWKKVHLFWGDERCVPPTSEESNFRMADETLISRVSLPSENVHRIPVERPPAEAAAVYDREIREFFGLKDGEFPQFDLLMLGLGEDGHTASLFPGTTAIQGQNRIVTEVYVEKLKTHRITMTLPTINHAASVVFLVEGSNKASIIREVMETQHKTYPAQLVRPVPGELLWFVDQAAASELQTVNHQ